MFHVCPKKKKHETMKRQRGMYCASLVNSLNRETVYEVIMIIKSTFLQKRNKRTKTCPLKMLPKSEERILVNCQQQLKIL